MVVIHFPNDCDHSPCLPQVRCARIDPSGEMIVSCSNDQTVRVWSYANGECKHTLTNHTHVVEKVAWAPAASTDAINEMDGTDGEPLMGPFFASVSRDKGVIVWDATAGAALHMFQGHDSWARDVVFHPGGKLLLTCSDDKSAFLPPYSTPAPPRPRPRPHPISPTVRYAAVRVPASTTLICPNPHR